MAACVLPEPGLLPSTMSYKDRLELQRDSTALYNRLYNSSSTQGPVWQRLHADAGTRQVRAQSARPYKEGGNAPPQGVHTLSGFCSNSTNPSAQYTLDTFKTGLNERLGSENIPVESMHPMTAKLFHKKEPIQFLAAIRPDTMTTNQTMRMLGTYEPDVDYAKQFGMLIPAVCPGGPKWFHPDTVLTQKRPAEVHKGWATTTVNGPFGFSTSGRDALYTSSNMRVRPQSARNPPSSATTAIHAPSTDTMQRTGYRAPTGPIAAPPARIPLPAHPAAPAPPPPPSATKKPVRPMSATVVRTTAAAAAVAAAEMRATGNHTSTMERRAPESPAKTAPPHTTSYITAAASPSVGSLSKAADNGAVFTFRPKRELP